MKTLIKRILNLFKIVSKVVEVSKPKNIQDEVALGVTSNFLMPLWWARQSSTISEGEKEKMTKILDEHWGNRKNYFNHFCKSYYLGEERWNEIFKILAHHVKISSNETSTRIGQLLPNLEENPKENSTLDMYYLAQEFIKTIPTESLKKISEIVKLGADAYFQTNKENEEKWRETRANEPLQAAKVISTDRDSLFFGTGMMISSILSSVLGKTGLRMGIF